VGQNTALGLSLITTTTTTTTKRAIRKQLAWDDAVLQLYIETGT